MNNDQSSCVHDPSTACEMCDTGRVPHSPKKQPHGKRVIRLTYTRVNPYIRAAVKFVGKQLTREGVQSLFEWLTQFS